VLRGCLADCIGAEEEEEEEEEERVYQRSGTFAEHGWESGAATGCPSLVRGREEEEEFFTHCKDDLERHAHTRQTSAHHAHRTVARLFYTCLWWPKGGGEGYSHGYC